MSRSHVRRQPFGDEKLRLRRAGREVVLHEREDRVAHRFVGDLHGVENWSEDGDFIDLLDGLGLKGAFECTPCNELLLSNGRRIWTISGDDTPLFYVVARDPADPACFS